MVDGPVGWSLRLTEISSCQTRQVPLMQFASDNWAGAHPAIAARLVTEAQGFAAPYGASDLDKAMEARFSEIFETDVSVFFVATGTAANSLALATVARPGGIVFCHSEAHVTADECGAPQFLTGANRLHTVPGLHGRMEPEALAAAINRFPPGAVHQGRPVAVTLTQSTEVGSIYALEEIEAMAAIAHARDLPLHMDGARFANALVALGCTPAEMTWKRGVDMLSFGGTKNGCWCAEAVVFFNSKKAEDFGYIRKRSAQLFSKSRFVAAQFQGYFDHGHWLDNAFHANTMAKRLATGINQLTTARTLWEPEANAVFAIWPKAISARLKSAGAQFYDWPGDGLADNQKPAETEDLVRLVTSFATAAHEVDHFLKALGK